MVYEYYAISSSYLYAKVVTANLTGHVHKHHHGHGHWTDVFHVVPVICFGYQCHVSVIPIYSCMKRRTKLNFTIAAFSAVLICFLSYTLTGAFGLWTFGADRVESDLLMNYSARRPEVMVAVAAMAAKTFATYPILLFCGREAIVSLIAECRSGGDTDSSTFYRLLRHAVSSVWFALSLAAALLVPNIGAVIQQLGCLAAVFIFILPGSALLSISLETVDAQEQEQSHSRRQKCRTWFGVTAAGAFVALGAFIFGVVFTQGIEGQGGGKEPPICYH